MKKLIFVCCAVLCASILSFAQSTTKKSITATSGETYVQKQGSYTPSFAVDGKQTKVKNVILLIGDGMGWGAVNSAMYGNGGEHFLRLNIACPRATLTEGLERLGRFLSRF